MKFAALVSGGKDSIYSIQRCQHFGHELVCIANLCPPLAFTGDEINSYMYQSAAYNVIPQIAKCLGVPMIRRHLVGTSLAQDMTYEATVGDEVEDLYELLKEVKETYPDVVGVSCGAIVSNYQRHRLENVCVRLNLLPLTFLWQRERGELLREMLDAGLDAVLVKVAAAGLDPYRHLGQRLSVLYPTLLRLNQRFEVDMCGEGGEYESIVLDCPAYKFYSLRIDESEVVLDSEDSSVGNLRIVQCSLVPKQLDNGASEATSSTEDKSQHCFSDAESQMVPCASWQASCNLEMSSAIETTPLIIPRALCINCDTFAAAEACLRTALSALMEAISRNSCYSVAFVRVYVATDDLTSELFSLINQCYNTFFCTSAVPSRCTVAVAGLPAPVAIDATLVSNNSARRVLHVRSVSEWAPVSIGPYAQCNTLANTFSFVAGQIGLVPATMELAAPAATPSVGAIDVLFCELYQALRNAANVLSAESSNIRNAVSVSVMINAKIRLFLDTATLNNIRDKVIAFSLGAEEVHAGDSDDRGDESNGAIPVVSLLMVSDLPRHAAVEVEVLALQSNCPLATSLRLQNRRATIGDKGVNNSRLCGGMCLPAAHRHIDASYHSEYDVLEASGLLVASYRIYRDSNSDEWNCMRHFARAICALFEGMPIYAHASSSLKIFYSSTFSRDALMLALGSAVSELFGGAAASVLLKSVTALPVVMVENNCDAIVQIHIIDMRRIESDAWIYGVNT